MDGKKEFSELVQSALKLIHERSPYLFGSGDMAEILQVSSPHLIREFRKEVGQSPTHYLIMYKLEQSKSLLLQDNFYIDTVANVVGFSCGNYFAKVFKKHFGLTPSQYILENKGKEHVEISIPEIYL